MNMSSRSVPSAIPSVDIIIPTTCEAKRWDCLQRAIGSVCTDQGVPVRVIVVVNGSRFDETLYQQLRQDPRLTVVYREQGSAPLAQRHGRSLVNADFFAFLDDDDEYLPGALEQRCAPMVADETLAFVATNGYRNRNGVDRISVRYTRGINTDPLQALTRENWLASCGGLYRTSSIPVEWFDDPAPYLEWTYLAFKLTVGFRMRFIDVPTFRINDTPGSLSKSAAYRDAELMVLAKILALQLPRHVRQSLQGKKGRVFHSLSLQSRREGRLIAAWRYHLRSMVLPQGWRYLAFSRKLLPFVQLP